MVGWGRGVGVTFFTPYLESVLLGFGRLNPKPTRKYQEKGNWILTTMPCPEFTVVEGKEGEKLVLQVPVGRARQERVRRPGRDFSKGSQREGQEEMGAGKEFAKC